MATLTDLLFHLDEWLKQIVSIHPFMAYLLLFIIIFMESAFFPIAPFLPGEGLLFSVGMLAANGIINIWLSIILMIVGGVLGNWLAYLLGQWSGQWLFERSKFNRKHIQQAHQFYEQYGNMAILLSRFIPIVRSIVPFIAGVAKMNPGRFWKNNLLSIILWVISITLIAFYLGHLPFIKHHFIWVIIGTVGFSLIPVVIAGICHQFKR